MRVHHLKYIEQTGFGALFLRVSERVMVVSILMAMAKSSETQLEQLAEALWDCRSESESAHRPASMSVYDEVEIEDMEYNAEEQVYYYPCPCGDKFFITLDELYDGEDIATCPSCSLTLRVVFEEDDLPELKEEGDEDEP